MITRLLAICLLALTMSLLAASSVRAAQCGGDFNTFLSAIAGEAAAAGVSGDLTARAFAAQP